MKIPSAVLAGAGLAAIGLIGCFGTESSRDAERNREVLQGTQVSARQLGSLSAEAAKASQAEIDLGFDEQQLIATLRSYGVCSNFIRLFEDLFACSDMPMSCAEQLPTSVIEYLACFGIDPYGSNMDSFDIEEYDFRELDACICKGTGSIFGNFAYAYYNGVGSVTQRSYAPPGGSASETYSAPSGSAAETYSAPGSPAGRVYGR